jgi:hypothetical protein
MNFYEILTTEYSDKWTEYLERLPSDQQDIYFTPEYYRLYEELGDGRAKCFVYVKEKDLALYPFLLNNVNDLGFQLDKEYSDIQGAYGYNGIITSNRHREFINGFYETFDHYCKENNIIAEFTRFHPLLKNEAFSKNHLAVTANRETVAADLTKDYSLIWESEYSSVNRNMIRKAGKMDYQIRILENPTDEDLDSFIEVYHHTLKLINAPEYYFFNRQFLFNTFARLQGQAFLLHVTDGNNKILASSVFMHHGDYFHYHLSGRSDKADNSVNNFLLDQALRFAKGRGAKFFHLGGGRSQALNDSLLKFKSNFSKLRLSFSIGKKIHNELIYNEVIRQWETKYPEKMGAYKKMLLRYRY